MMATRQFPTKTISTALTEVQYGLSLAASAKGNYPIVGMKDIRDGRIHVDESIRVELDDETAERFLLRTGDVLLNRTNSNELVGKCAIFDGGTPAVFASYLVRLKFDEKSLLPAFANYFLNSEYGQAQLKVLSTRAVSQANINPTTFRKHFAIPFPKLDEQRRIVCVLDAADRQIQLAEKIAHEAAGKVLAMTSSLVFQGLRSTAPFDIMKSKRLAKRGWKRTTIAQIASEVRRVNREGMALPVLSSTKQKGIVFSDDYFGKQVYSANTSTYKRVRRGEFVYATNHIEEGSIGMQDICDEGLVSPMYTVFELDEPLVDPYFLIAVLKTETYRQIFSANTSASVDRRGSLRWKDFSRLPVHLPDMDLQRAVAAQIAASKRYLEICNSRLNGMREQKRGLMQQLLTGQHRLTRDLPGMESGHV